MLKINQKKSYLFNQINKSISERENFSFFHLKMAILVSMEIIGVLLILFTPFISQLVGIVIMGLMFAHAVELQHEVLHMRGRNIYKRCLGFFLGLPMLNSFSHYQFNHMQHHRLVGTKDDTEFFNYGERELNLASFLMSLTMFTHYKNVINNILNAFLGKAVKVGIPNIERQIRMEYIFQGIAILAIILGSLLMKNTLFIKLWLIPLLFVAMPVHVLIELPEHQGCELGDIFKSTRTIQAGPLISWFVNGNNFHVEHHYAPALPISHLRALNSQINDQISYQNNSYVEFYKVFFKKLMRFNAKGE